jgi:hypothetical protein
MRVHTSATTEVDEEELGTKGAYVGDQLSRLGMTYLPVPPSVLCRLVYLYCPRYLQELIKTMKPLSLGGH